MAPDLAQGPDERPVSLARGMISYVAIIAVCAALAAIFYFTATWLKARHAGFAVGIGASVLYGAALLGAVWVWSRNRSAGACTPPSPAARQYRRRQLLAAALYAAVLIGAIEAHEGLRLAGPLAYAIAVAPAAPVIWMIAAMGLYLREETDEFQRSLRVESSLWATGGMLSITAVWGFLEMFDLVPHVEAWAVTPLWALLLGLANLFTRRRYQ